MCKTKYVTIIVRIFSLAISSLFRLSMTRAPMNYTAISKTSKTVINTVNLYDMRKL